MWSRLSQLAIVKLAKKAPAKAGAYSEKAKIQFETSAMICGSSSFLPILATIVPNYKR